MAANNDNLLDESRNLTAPKWMRQVLLAAAGYNLLWGAVAILLPEWTFRLLHFDPLPNYPELWQCLGMVIGVYGVGYAIAAVNVHRHWPIVFVGLLGKIFGPVGFLLSYTSGRLPASFGWMILCNDLIWWVPFAAMLWSAAKSHQAGQHLMTVSPPRLPIDPLGRMVSHRGATVRELSRRSPLLLVFLRHSGCIFCRQSISDLARHRAEIEQAGATIAIVHMGSDRTTALIENLGLGDLHCFSDHAGVLYRTFGLQMGGFRQLFGPGVWYRMVRALLAGHRLGLPDGNTFRMPGVFLVSDGQVMRSYLHRTAADRPDYSGLATLP